MPNVGLQEILSALGLFPSLDVLYRTRDAEMLIRDPCEISYSCCLVVSCFLFSFLDVLFMGMQEMLS